MSTKSGVIGMAMDSADNIGTKFITSINNLHRKFSENTNYTCIICKRGFPFKKLLREHIFLEHNDSEPFNCPNCDFLADRYPVDIKTKPFECKSCGYKLDFSQKYSTIGVVNEENSSPKESLPFNEDGSIITNNVQHAARAYFTRATQVSLQTNNFQAHKYTPGPYIPTSVSFDHSVPKPNSFPSEDSYPYLNYINSLGLHNIPDTTRDMFETGNYLQQYLPQSNMSLSCPPLPASVSVSQTIEDARPKNTTNTHQPAVRSPRSRNRVLTNSDDESDSETDDSEEQYSYSCCSDEDFVVDSDSD